MKFSDFLESLHCPHGFIAGCQWCQTHSRISPSFLALAGFGGSFFAFNQWGLIPAVYILMVLIPLILGMAGKIEFKWVILWLCVMLLPIGIFILLFFGGAIISLFRRS